MIVGYAEIHLRLQDCHSLKEKRRAIHGPIERIRSGLGASVSEVGDQELWGNAEIGIACVSSNTVQVESVLDKAIQILESSPALAISFINRDVMRI
jgi:uncharacterized protein YlxP (DUF503 family)